MDARKSRTTSAIQMSAMTSIEAWRSQNMGYYR